MVKEPKFFTILRGYAFIIGTGGVAALQAMKFELFSFPVIEWNGEEYDLRIIFIYFFSIVTVLCVFIGGFTLLEKIREGLDELGKLKDIKAREEEKNKKHDETNQ